MKRFFLICIYSLPALIIVLEFLMELGGVSWHVVCGGATVPIVSGGVLGLGWMAWIQRRRGVAGAPTPEAHLAMPDLHKLRNN